MLTLVTGVPGAGKTLNVIKEVYERYQAEWHGRNVYYYNINELKIPAWHELTLDQALRWYELPKGSVLIFDEAQALCPVRDFKKEVPPHVHEMSTHRHKGYDIFLITQHPMLLDSSARRMVGRHWHFDRKFGSPRVNRYSWNRVSDDPNDWGQKQEAVKDAVKLDKRIFELYKSSELHTHKFRLPFKAVAALAFFPVAGIVGWYLLSGLTDRDTDITGNPLIGEAVAETSGSFFSENPYEPRIPGVPGSAPIYDHLNKAVSFPRLQCVQWSDGVPRPVGTKSCRCFTQQATVVDVPYKLCSDIVAKGYFDPTVPDRFSQTARATPLELPPGMIVDTL